MEGSATLYIEKHKKSIWKNVDKYIAEPSLFSGSVVKWYERSLLNCPTPYGVCGFNSHRFLHILRVSYNGITLAFQANDRGSIPLTRSKF